MNINAVIDLELGSWSTQMVSNVEMGLLGFEFLLNLKQLSHFVSKRSFISFCSSSEM